MFVACLGRTKARFLTVSGTAWRNVVPLGWWCKWSTTFHLSLLRVRFLRNFCRTQIAVSNRLSKLETISTRFVAAILRGFRTCSKLDANLQSLSENVPRHCAEMTELVYTCDLKSKACAGKIVLRARQKFCKNRRTCKRTYSFFRICKLLTC